MGNIYCLQKDAKEELVIEKSKFISFAYSVATEQEVKNILENLKKEFFDATHICYAYDLMSGKQKCYDDGEPQGTSGKPILDCIQKQNLKNVLVAVVRYFGGIKLGAGGLVRAYSKSASLAIKSAGKKDIVLCKKIEFLVLPNEFNKMQILNKLDFVLENKTEFSKNIKITAIIKNENEYQFINYLKNILNREIDILSNENIYH